MLIVIATVGCVLMVGACLTLAFEDVIEAKSNLAEEVTEEFNSLVSG